MSCVFDFASFNFAPGGWVLSGPEGPIDVQHKALELLAVLLEQPGEVVSSAELTERLWPDTVVTEQSLRQAVRKLRAALRDDDGTLVVTVRGKGVKLAAPVRISPLNGEPMGAVGPPTAGAGAATCRVLLVDDHALFRGSLRMLLESTGRFAVIGEAGAVEAGVALSRELAPDVVLMDVELGRESGLDATAEILASRPEARVLLLTGRTDWSTVSRGIQLGVRGVLSKAMDPDELIEQVQAAAEGRLTVAQEALDSLFRGLAALDTR